MRSLNKIIVFEDENLIVVNKPPGLLVTPTPKNESHTLISLVNDLLRQRQEYVKAHLCHRLDRETSGLIVLAKGKSNQQKIMEQFHKKQVHKKYIAFVQWYLKKDSGTINHPLENKEALTRYRVLQRHPRGFSVVEVEPLTGRTNQIRLHFKMSGHPLVGERKYAFGRDAVVKFHRAALHAMYLEIIHPAKNEAISFHSELASDMQRLL